jgi:hypothetical protein
MVHVGLYSVGTHHKNFCWENKTNKNTLCRVSRDDTRQSSLCRVSPGRHSAKNCKIIFAECRPGDTRQRLLYRVSPIWHSAKRILKIKKSLPSARSRVIEDATRSSVRYVNLIEWRSRRWWSKAPSEQFLAITTPRLRWLSPVTHEWPRHEGLSLQAQSRTQARTGKKHNQNCIDYGIGSHKPMMAILFDDRIDLSKTQNLMWRRLLNK